MTDGQDDSYRAPANFVKRGSNALSSYVNDGMLNNQNNCQWSIIWRKLYTDLFHKSYQPIFSTDFVAANCPSCQNQQKYDNNNYDRSSKPCAYESLRGSLDTYFIQKASTYYQYQKTGLNHMNPAVSQEHVL